MIKLLAFLSMYKFMIAWILELHAYGKWWQQSLGIGNRLW